MNNNDQIKAMVREKYSAIASQTRETNKSSCCGATTLTDNSSLMADDYEKLEGYAPEADLGLGCGLPTEYAGINKGDTVLDLGSGAGNDAFIARRLAGETGTVIGVDFTEAMVSRAKENAQKLGYSNVEFRLGDIEDLPVTSDFVNVILSNCVLNLVPNKHKVFSEMFRVLKPGGHFSISDIVIEGNLPDKWKQVAELYAGCVSGAIPKTEYLSIIKEAGFDSITLQKEKNIDLPDELLAEYFSPQEINEYRNSGARITSITVYGKKPSKDDRNCCSPGSGCC
jgi:ubiquinone/menaquinone biosynthesis C-methylase UbiE